MRMPHIDVITHGYTVQAQKLSRCEATKWQMNVDVCMNPVLPIFATEHQNDGMLLAPTKESIIFRKQVFRSGEHISSCLVPIFLQLPVIPSMSPVYWRLLHANMTYCVYDTSCSSNTKPWPCNNLIFFFLNQTEQQGERNMVGCPKFRKH